MSIQAINEQLLRAIGVGIALVDIETLSFLYRNETFLEWFEGFENQNTVLDVLPTIDPEFLIRELEEKGKSSLEVSFKKKRRTLMIAVNFTLAHDGEGKVVILACQNISRIRELEAMIDSYASMVERNTRELQREKKQVEKLLLNMLPRSVYEEYKTFGVVTPRLYDPVSVLMLDFVGFTDMAASRDPVVTVSELNDIYSAFDRIGEQYGCERIKTIGDAYIAVSGLPEPMPDHAQAVANTAIRFVRYLERRNEGHSNRWLCRIGLATGSVVGSVVGIQKYVYDVFGPAVNLASRLQGCSEPMEITVHKLLRDSLKDEFLVEDAGIENLKGFGNQELFKIRDGRVDIMLAGYP